MQGKTKLVPSLPIHKALELVPLADGNLYVADLPVLSLPCVIESRESPARSVIVTHFERAREDYLMALREKPIAKIQFVTGFYYIDPSWIPRAPHAPTEVKAVFEIKGRATLIERSGAKTLAMMEKLTEAKQALFAPESEWKIQELPNQYTDRLFPMIVELEIETDEYQLSRLMVLQHISREHRNQILGRINAQNNPCSRAVERLFEVAYR